MLAAFTLFHVVISLVGIATGLLAAFGLRKGERLDRVTAWFLATTAATSVTGFLFPFQGVTPGIIIGALSLLILAPAAYGRYQRGLAGGWRKTYVIGAMVALYFNLFVLIVQSFRKVPVLNSLAPTQTEAPFAAAQLVVLVGMAWLGFQAVRGFREPAPVKAMPAGAR